MFFQDGTGKGYLAQVDANNRLHSECVTRDQLFEACQKGEGFNFNTGSITLTTANESAIGHITYNGDHPFIITEILFIIDSTTGGSGDGVARIYKNPTGGTIVSNAVPVEVAENRDFSSSIVVDGDLYKGAEGNTTTGGSVFASSDRSSFGTVISFDAAPIILRKANSLSCSWQPPAGNTSQGIKIAATGYILGADITG